MGSRALALLVGCVAALALLEGGLRLHNPIPLPLRGSDIVLPANGRFRYEYRTNGTTHRVVHNTFNRLGFRGPEPPAAWDEHTTVITVGGSTTACVTLDDGETWPDQLAERLTPRVPALWVNNAGIDGHSTFGHLILLRQALARLEPDVVIYLIGVNDIGRDDLNDWDRRVTREHTSIRDRIVRRSELLSTAQVLWRTWRAVDVGVPYDPSIDVPALPAVQDDPAEVARTLQKHRRRYVPGYRARVEALVRESRRAGIAPVLLTQPALYGPRTDPTTGVDLASRDFLGEGSALRQWKILELYNDVVREVGRAEHAQVVDLAAAMPKDTRYFQDWVHFTPEGARRVAAIVADALAPRLASPGRRAEATVAAEEGAP